MSNQLDLFLPPLTDDELNDIFDTMTSNVPQKSEIKCECGSEKVYGKKGFHAHWCPKAKK